MGQREASSAYNEMCGFIRYATHAAYFMALRASCQPHSFAWPPQRFKPASGQLVCEISTIYNRKKHFVAVGHLLEVRREWVDANDEPLPPEVEPNAEEYSQLDAWYIRLLDGSKQRWVNCQFIAVPDGPNFTHDFA